MAGNHSNPPRAETSLHAACWNGYLGHAEYLLQRGADPNSSCIDEASQMYSRLPLSIACERGKSPSNEKLVRLLVEHGARINAVDCTRNTALNILLGKAKKYNGLSVKQRYAALIQFLLENGADVNIPGENGQAPLDVAVECQFQDVVFQMLKLGAYINPYERARVPLIAACSVGDYEIVRILLEHGADANAINHSGDTWPDVTLHTKWLIKLFVEHGARIDDSLITLGRHRFPEQFSFQNILACPTRDVELGAYLLKAGAGLKLMSLCCEERRTCGVTQLSLTPSESHLSEDALRLLQAVVLSGYVATSADMEKIERSGKPLENQEIVRWFQEERRRPPSLMRLCRVVIRRQLSIAGGYKTILPAIDGLLDQSLWDPAVHLELGSSEGPSSILNIPLPEDLKLYLKFEGPLTEIDLSRAVL